MRTSQTFSEILVFLVASPLSKLNEEMLDCTTSEVNARLSIFHVVFPTSNLVSELHASQSDMEVDAGLNLAFSLAILELNIHLSGSQSLQVPWGSRS